MRNQHPSNRTIRPNNSLGDERKDRLLTVLLTSVQGEVLWRYELEISHLLSVPEIAAVVPQLLARRKNLTGQHRSKQPGPQGTRAPWNRPDDLPEYLKRR